MFEIGKMITGAIGNVLGISNKEGESQLLELFKGQKQKQREFELELEKLFQKRLEQEIADVQSAREMQAEALKQSDVFSKRFVYYLSGGLLLLTCIAAILPFWVVIPPENVNLVNRATDFLYMVSGGTIISFYFGTKNTKK